MRDSSYRSDIDGLRAYAVLSVILFHVGFDTVSGGFVGVDVFFVISGFLITRLIVKELSKTGAFDFQNFFVRRIRRLFPALFFTLSLSLVCSIILFSPMHLERFGGSLIHALTSISNFYFWTEADYFDSVAYVKPLLHTWSLSVEEQYYLIWPMIIVLVYKIERRYLLPLVLCGAVIASLYMNHAFADGQVKFISDISTMLSGWISDGKTTIFYLLPFRVYEFAIGGLLVFIVRAQLRSRLAHEILLLLGFAMIVYANLMFTKDMIFPGYVALIPCIGTALIIYSGDKALYFGKLLTNNIAVGIGIISYSLYLIHWPIIVYWRYISFNKLSSLEGVIVIIMSIAIAAAMYKYVEQPFRKNKNHIGQVQVKPVLFTLLSLAVVVSISSNIWSNNGWVWRVNAAAQEGILPPREPQSALKGMDKSTQWTKAYQFGSQKRDAVKVLVLGDSHADQLRRGAGYLSSKYNLSFTFYTFTGCPPIFGTYKVYGAPSGITREGLKQIKCREQTRIWEDYIKNNKYNYVIIASRWNWLFEPTKYYDTIQRRDLLVNKKDPIFSVKKSKQVFLSYLDYTIKIIHNTGAKAIVFGQVPNEGINMEGCGDIPKLLFNDDRINQRCSHVPRRFVIERSRFSNEAITKIADENNAIKVLPTEYFCQPNEEYCQNHYKGVILKRDDNHLSDYGSIYLIREWEKSAHFPFANELNIRESIP